MKPNTSAGRKSGTGPRKSGPAIPPLPMEWMDPMSWRLPSGQALAEFALQAGFLAPLIMGGPRLKKRAAVDVEAPAPAALRQKEAPECTGTFRTR